MDIARRYVLVDTAFAALPVRCPEPSLVGRHRHMWMQLDHAVLALNNLDLGTRLIQMVAAPYRRRQDNLSTPTDSDERSLAHGRMIADLP